MKRQLAIGLLFVALLSGQEAVRVTHDISTNTRIQGLGRVVGADVAAAASEASKEADEVAVQGQQRLQHTWWINWHSNFGHSVCPQERGMEYIKNRYERKSRKLLGAVKDLRRSGLEWGAFRGKLREVLERTEAFGDCVTDARTKPELVDLIEAPRTGVMPMVQEVFKGLLLTFNESSATSWEPDPAIGCTMKLTPPPSDVIVTSDEEFGKVLQRSFYLAAYKPD
eukprot:TRINITY_DN38230_c0_g1_i1.p1 TRINITY_DN38230_c0_g1~~TRINITY_DN38230_c0_g1_i1.p1  ORF type:complete len:235 (+),score=41.58 TRINITY_DN38230_c0_g1_i1:32-706(+)